MWYVCTLTTNSQLAQVRASLQPVLLSSYHKRYVRSCPLGLVLIFLVWFLVRLRNFSINAMGGYLDFNEEVHQCICMATCMMLR